LVAYCEDVETCRHRMICRQASVFPFGGEILFSSSFSGLNVVYVCLPFQILWRKGRPRMRIRL
jgi:hypothetical protein